MTHASAMDVVRSPIESEARGRRGVAREFSPRALERVRQAHRGDVERCTGAARQQNPNPEGRLTVRVVVGPQGAVTEASVGASTVPVRSFGPCLASAVRRWVFPAPASGAAVSVELVFVIEPLPEPPPRRFTHGER